MVDFKKLGKKPIAPAKPRMSALAAAVAEAELDEAREPLFDPGREVAAFLSIAQQPPKPGKNEWVKAVFRCRDGVERAVLFCVSNRSMHASAKRIKSLCAALLGAPDLDALAQVDPENAFLDALMGLDNGSCFADPEDPRYAGNYVGKDVEVITQRGADIEEKPGEFFRNTSFRMVEDDAPEDAAE